MKKKFIKLEHEYVDLLLTKFGGIILIIISSFLALSIHKSGLIFESGDWIAHYSLWYDNIKMNGGLFALGKNIGDYPSGFNLLLALFTYIPITPHIGFKYGVLLFDFFAAIISYFIVKEVNKSKYLPSFTYATVLLMPSIFLNTSVWGQVDILYITTLLLAMHFLIKKDYKVAFFVIGISLSLKQTAIFIFPTLAILYLREKNISIIQFINIILGYIFMSLPALFCGKKIVDIFIPYNGFGTGITGTLVANFSNIFYLVTPDPTWSSWVSSEMYTKIGTSFCVFIIGSIILLMYYKNVDTSGSNIFLLTAMFVVVICNFLPGIHDRYMLLADVTSVLYLFSSKRYKDIWIPIFINFVSVFNIINYLRGISADISNTRIVLTQIVSIMFLFISLYFIYYVINVTCNVSAK